MTSRVCALFALLFSILLIDSGAARAEKRLALVIGNSSYRTVTVLPNPAKDAKAMTDLLRAAQFEVTEADNLAQADMGKALRDFAAKVAQSGPETVALLFYAGHGVQIDGENYLVPVDVNIQREADVPIQAMRLHDVMNILSSVPSKTLMVVLDACRNNPFSDINKTIGRGLAIVDAPKGTFVSYSTSPGATALDGDADHSPFTAALVEIARQPGVAVEQTFKNVRIAVHKTTRGQQTPWESTSLTADFEFFPGAGDSAKPTDKPADQTADKSAEQTANKSADKTADTTKVKTIAEWKADIEKRPPEEAFELVLGADVVEAYQAYVELFPAPPLGPRVRGLLLRRQEMIAWQLAVTLNTEVSFQTFLDSYPNSDLAATAQRLLERAKTRALALGAQASVPNGATRQIKVVEKIVRVPVEKIVEVPKIVERVVEKPVIKIVERVVEKPVRKVVYECPPSKKERRRRRHHSERAPSDDDRPRPAHPAYVPDVGIRIGVGGGGGIPFGGHRGGGGGGYRRHSE